MNGRCRRCRAAGEPLAPAVDGGNSNRLESTRVRWCQGSCVHDGDSRIQCTGGSTLADKQRGRRRIRESALIRKLRRRSGPGNRTRDGSMGGGPAYALISRAGLESAATIKSGTAVRPRGFPAPPSHDTFHGRAGLPPTQASAGRAEDESEGFMTVPGRTLAGRAGPGLIAAARKLRVEGHSYAAPPEKNWMVAGAERRRTGHSRRVE
jgi:hypothetical protein